MCTRFPSNSKLSTLDYVHWCEQCVRVFPSNSKLLALDSAYWCEQCVRVFPSNSKLSPLDYAHWCEQCVHMVALTSFALYTHGHIRASKLRKNAFIFSLQSNDYPCHLCSPWQHAALACCMYRYYPWEVSKYMVCVSTCMSEWPPWADWSLYGFSKLLSNCHPGLIGYFMAFQSYFPTERRHLEWTINSKEFYSEVIDWKCFSFKMHLI